MSPGTDEHWMARALQQAHHGLCSTHPNPRVGCVIVRDGQCLAEGFHAYAGGPHAEIHALGQAAGGINGATVYVSLEPCSHTGRTAPCSDALIAAQPARVVVGMQDPNPLVAGRGISRLREAGIQVDVGVLEAQAQALNPGFIKRMQHGRPFVRVKMAASLDGRTALSNGVSQWITGREARRDVQLLRARSSAVLSSAATVVADDASLNVRLEPADLGQQRPVRQPIRVILDPELILTGQETLFSIDAPIWIVTANPDTQVRRLLQKDHVEFIDLPADDGRFDLDALMHLLAQHEINEVHTECGPGLAGALLRQGLADELVLYQAPCLLGSAAQGLFDLGEISIMSDRTNLRIQDVRRVGEDFRFTMTLE